MVTSASSATDAQTTRHACPCPARCVSHTKLLRVEPPRAGAYDALEVRRIRIRLKEVIRLGLPPPAAPSLHRRTTLRSLYKGHHMQCHPLDSVQSWRPVRRA